MIEKSCLLCIHKEVCKFYSGEMARRNYWHKDFIEELNKLQNELACKCTEYCKNEKLTTKTL